MTRDELFNHVSELCERLDNMPKESKPAIRKKLKEIGNTLKNHKKQEKTLTSSKSKIQKIAKKQREYTNKLNNLTYSFGKQENKND